MYDTLLPLAVGLLAASGVMTALWRVQRVTGNAGIVDVAWAAVVGGLGVSYAAVPVGFGWLRALAGAMIGLWSARLTRYLYRRVVGRPEEGRYVCLREQWGDHADARFFRFYQFQAVAAWVFAMPILVICRSDQPPAPAWAFLSVAMWIIGVGGVALADRQLERFKSRDHSRGRTCREGLWRYSRHPNYFFEWVHWCSYVPLAAGSGYWWINALVAALLLLTVLFVTGIPPTEAQALASRGDDYRRYQQNTSAFLPWFPKSGG